MRQRYLSAAAITVLLSAQGAAFAQATPQTQTALSQSPQSAPQDPRRSSAQVAKSAVDRPSNQAIPPDSTDQPTAPSYYIGPGDQLQLTVYGYEEYTKSLLVLSDGTISLPVIGTVMAAGKTPDELAALLTTRLEPYLVNPSVSVSIANLRPITVNVAGEVQRPGPIQLRSVTTTASNATSATTNAGILSLQSPTVAAALLEAGGITRNADIRRVVLKRFTPQGNAPAITINLWDAIVSENGFRNFVLQDGDALFVPKLPAGEQIDRRLIARSSLAPNTIRVRVVGEVKAPGQVLVPPDSSISGAVAIAGGPTDKARLSQVTLVRLDEAGKLAKKTIDLSNLADTEQVEEGDVIVVPKSGTYKFLDVASVFLNPLSFLTTILYLFK